MHKYHSILYLVCGCKRCIEMNWSILSIHLKVLFLKHIRNILCWVIYLCVYFILWRWYTHIFTNKQNGYYFFQKENYSGNNYVQNNLRVNWINKNIREDPAFGLDTFSAVESDTFISKSIKSIELALAGVSVSSSLCSLSVLSANVKNGKTLIQSQYCKLRIDLQKYKVNLRESSVWEPDAADASDSEIFASESVWPLSLTWAPVASSFVVWL